MYISSWKQGIHCCLLYGQLLPASGHKFMEVFFANALAKLWLKIQAGTFFSSVH